MRRVLPLVLVAAAVLAPVAGAGARLGTYFGKSKYTSQLQVQVNLQLRSATSADFGIGASAPCNKPGYAMGRTVNTYQDPARPRLALHNGRFTFTHHAVFTTTGVQIVTTHQMYTLTGHATSKTTFAGTVRVFETTNTGVTCDTGTVAWTATWSQYPFPK